MTSRTHNPGNRIDRRRARLLALKLRIEQQLKESECLISALDDYCTECPDDPPCASNDPAWRRHLAQQHEHLAAMRSAIKERLEKITD